MTQLNLNEIANVLIETGNKMTALPATAQVAAQQGHYLGTKLNKLAKRRDEGKDMHPHTAEESRMSMTRCTSRSVTGISAVWRILVMRRRSICRYPEAALRAVDSHVRLEEFLSQREC